MKEQIFCFSVNTFVCGPPNSFHGFFGQKLVLQLHIFLRCQLSHICYPPLQGLGRDGGQAGDGGERCEPDPPPPLLLPLTHPVLQQGAQLGRHEQPPAPPHRQDRQAGAELCREQCHLQEVSAHLCRPVQGPEPGSAQGQDIKVGKTF